MSNSSKFVKLLGLKIILEDLTIKWDVSMRLYFSNLSAISIAHKTIEQNTSRLADTSSRRGWTVD